MNKETFSIEDLQQMHKDKRNDILKRIPCEPDKITAPTTIVIE